MCLVQARRELSYLPLLTRNAQLLAKRSSSAAGSTEERDLRLRKDSWSLGRDSFEGRSMSYGRTLCHTPRGHLKKHDCDEMKGKEAFQHPQSLIVNQSGYKKDAFTLRGNGVKDGQNLARAQA